MTPEFVGVVEMARMALFSPQMAYEGLSEDERATVMAALKADYVGRFSTSDLMSWMHLEYGEARRLWAATEAHGSPFVITHMASLRGFLPPKDVQCVAIPTNNETDTRIGNKVMFKSLYDSIGDRLPKPEPALIDGILAKGSKMLISAPSKSGKTWIMIDLMYSLATGGEWLGMRCAESSCLYVNMEVGASQFSRRCDLVRASMGISDEVARRIHVLNGRGVGLSAGELADEIATAFPEGLGVVFVDTLYMLEEGDENSATDMKRMLVELDRLAETCGSSLVLVHHHAKGTAGQKDTIDRMAGSGVFARYPDAILDLSPLRVDEGSDEWHDLVTYVNGDAEHAKAMRLSFELRDYAPHEPLDLIFTNGRFYPDESGRLEKFNVKGSRADGAARGGDGRKAVADEARERNCTVIREVLDDCASDGVTPTRAEVLDRFNKKASANGLKQITASTLRSWTVPSGKYPFRVDGETNGLMEVSSNE